MSAVDADRFEFMLENDGSLSLESAVFQALGAASMCWAATPAGVFESDQAKAIGVALVAFVQGQELRPRLRQTAPYPTLLAELVRTLRYRPGWTFELIDFDRGQGSEGLTLDIVTCGYDGYHPQRGETYRVHHYMPVPPAAYDRRSWCRWLLEQLLLVERHEACEFFRLEYDLPNRVGTEILGTSHHVDRPYAPHHGPGNDPYIVFEHGTDQDVRTSFRGDVKDAG